MRLATCVWPCGCIVPPITPNEANGAPSLVMKPGMMVLSGRFRGPTRFGWPACGDEAGAAIVERDAGARHDDARAETVIVRLDQRDHHAVLVRRREIDGRAAVHRARGGDGDAVAAGSLRANSSSRAGSRSSAGVTVMKSGSATCARTSAVPSFSASICRCSISALSGARPSRSSRSRMPSAISAAMPWPFGGSSWTRWPRNSTSIGVDPVAVDARRGRPSS